MARNKTKSDSRTVRLHSGGRVTVTLEGNVFDLSGADRDFVNRLTEMVQSYETPEQLLIQDAGQEASPADTGEVPV
jgi:hypothetical protein